MGEERERGMNNRQRGIFLRLVGAEKAITSDQLARELGVSSRTIKTDMAAMASELEQNGARIISRRNRGYTLEVTDEERMRKLHNLSRIRSGGVAAADEEGRVIHIARKLVASERGVMVDELAEQMYVSRGALRAPLQEALRFCQSFRLQTVSTPGKGLRVEGEEHQIRLIMTELFGVHFHQAELVSGDREYTRWIQCDYQERQDIRHVFLKVLRESPYAVRDSISQRISMYLILARNRRRAGMYLDLPAQWVREVRQLPIFQLARDIFTALEGQFQDYQADTTEACFLAILLLANLDVDLNRDPTVTAPFLVPQATQAARAMLERFREEVGVDLTQLPDAEELLIQVVLPILAKTRYGIDGIQQFDWGMESSYLQLPVESSCARLMADELMRCGCRVGHIDISTLSCYLTALLRQVEYPTRPLRLMVTNAVGGEFGRLAAAELKERWPKLVESVTPIELYAIRGVDPGNYDAILLGHVSDEPGANFTYNYDAPAVPLNLARQGADFGRIHNSVLVDAYRFGDLIPPAEIFHVWSGFHYYNEEQAIQFMAAQYGKDLESVQRLARRLARWEKELTLSYHDVAVLLAGPNLCREPCLDLYHLSKPGKWGENRIQWILFAGLGCESLPQMRAMAVALANLTKYPQFFEQFAQKPRETILKELKNSVKYL